MSSDSVMPRARRPLVALACAAVVAAALPLAATLPESSATPPAAVLAPSLVPPPATPDLGPAIDGEADYQGQDLCSPKAKAGAKKLVALINATYGPSSIGISRGCSVGGQSEHKEGRALDWMLNVKKKKQKAKADSFLAWLLAADRYGNPAAMAQRLGVMYIGWNNKFWRGYDIGRGWTDLKGCSTDPAKKKAAYNTYCHRNHVHISLTWEGASALTSFWTRTPLPPTCSPGWGTPTGSAPVAGGDLVPVTPVRVLSSYTGLGQAERCRIGQVRWSGDRRDVIVPVLGAGEVPESGVAAVAVRVAISRPSSPVPTVYARATPTSPRVAVVTALTAQEYSSTAVVPVAGDGTFRLQIDRGSADVTVDVLGWAPPKPAPLPAAAVATGAAHVVAPTLAYDGIAAPLKPGETRTLALAGKAGIPTSGLGALFLTVSAPAPSATSWLSLAGAPGTAVVATMRAATASPSARQLVVPGASGKLTLRNHGTVPVPFEVRTTGWTTTSPTAGGGALSLLASPVVVADSAANAGLVGPAASTASRSFALPTKAKVPVGADAVLVQVSGRGGTAAGTLTIGSRGAVRVFGMAKGKWSHDVVLLPLSAARTIAVSTTSLGSSARVTVLGYVS
jgi:hypothetical protein